jgi:hypothetical protein
MAFMAAARPQVPDSNAIIGFETPNGWIVRDIHHHGDIHHRTSLPVASTAAALAGIGASRAEPSVEELLR